MSLARLMVLYLVALHLLFIVGCLCESECTTAAYPDFEDSEPVTLIGDANDRYISAVEVTTGKPVITPAATQAPTPFTGAVVSVAENCEPCHWLLTDLEMLRIDHGWTLAEATENRPAQWIIEHDRPGITTFPLIEFYKDGQLVLSRIGYTASPNFADRRDSLVDLVATHNKIKL